MMTTSQTLDKLIRISSITSLPRQQLSDYNIGQLAEFKAVPDGAVIEKSVTPLFSPYNRQKNSLPIGT
jgi:hypothetical protein